MGRMLGAFDPSNDLDRPDLNKCPDCGCYFPEEKCPLCGKVCPEEMRAGNRKAQKKKKIKSYNERVTFIEWYHSWWFIVLMLFVWPLLGIVLLLTSPRSKKSKIIFILIGVLYIVARVAIPMAVEYIWQSTSSPVDASLSREEYVERCNAVSCEDFYRTPDRHSGEFITMTLTVKERFMGYDDHTVGDNYTTYYICTDTDGEFEIILRDCILDGAQSFIAGDTVTIYGEGAGNTVVYDMEYTPHMSPTIFVAYAELVK